MHMLPSLLRDRSALSLLAATPVLFVATGLWALPIAAWIAPVLLLRFVRDQPLGRGVAITALVLGVVSCVTWYGATGRFLPFPLPYVVGAALGLVATLPYLIDRLLTSRLSGFAATLVLPTAAVAVEYAASFGPFGTWGSAAYTQQSLPLLQFTSVTGIWGITFLLYWTASVVNAAWETRLASTQVRWSLGLWAGVLASVLLFGGARLTFSTTSDTVPTAAVTGSYNASMFGRVHRAEERRAATRDSARAVQREYLRRARRAGRMGARLVSWPEAAVPVPVEDTSTFFERARTVAADEAITLALAVNIFPRSGTDAHLENKVVWIGPDGTRRTEGLKTNLVPGEPGRAGTGPLPQVSTRWGTAASAVCYDLDFPALIRQAGRQNVDLLVAPSNDWSAIAKRHAHMAHIRAIENGVSLLRPTSNGNTLATGPLGRTRARTNHFTTQDHLQLAHLPTNGPSTLYATLGDFFAWGCGLGLLLLTGIARFQPRLPALSSSVRSE
jgi:apolipoprotein N-acyltransferase